MDRRELIHFVAGTVAASSLVNTAATTSAEMPSKVDFKLNDGDVILFQGDSITDARRDKKKLSVLTVASAGTKFRICKSDGKRIALI